MTFEKLARYLTQLDETRSRNAMTEILAEILGELSPLEIKPVCYLLLGGLGPAYGRVDFQLADKMVVRAIAQATGMTISEVWGEYKKLGDLGTVASKLKVPHYDKASWGRQNSKVKAITQNSKLSVTEAYNRLMEIAEEKGAGSQERKISGLAELIHLLDSVSVKYVVRIVLGRLRLGFSDKTLLDALSVMVSGGKTARTQMEKAYQVYPDIGEIAKLANQYLPDEIPKHVSVKLGVPVMPALCQRMKTPNEMIEKMGRVFVEPKYDGTRVQIHIKKKSVRLSGGTNPARSAKDDKPDLNSLSGLSKSKDDWEVKTFTRNLEETTLMFPELLGSLDQVNAEEAIFDSEAVGWDPKTGKMLPFQETITRKRIYEVEAAQGRVPLKFNVFDVLYCDGKEYINLPFWERRKKLVALIKPGQIIKVVQGLETENPNELRSYHAEKLREGFEGVVVKQIMGLYEPGRQGFNWVKFKEAETAMGKLADTIDAVVMGFYWGKGKRTGFGLGAFLVGIRGENDKILTLAKIGTGLADDQWLTLKKRLDEHVRMDQPHQYNVDKNLFPDVWVDPRIVVEIAADEITKSPNHSAGFALRFPRLVRFRDDKDLAGVTTISELLKIRG